MTACARPPRKSCCVGAAERPSRVRTPSTATPVALRRSRGIRDEHSHPQCLGRDSPPCPPEGEGYMKSCGRKTLSTPAPGGFSQTQNRECFDETHFCACGVPLVRGGKRGPWPVRCESCRRRRERIQEAARRARKPREVRACTCGAPLVRGGTRGRWPSMCGVCRRLERRSRTVKRGTPVPTVAVCEHCGRGFERDHGNPGPAPKYCSPQCRRAARAAAQRGAGARREPLCLECAGCGRAFESLRKRKYCSPSCWVRP